MAEPTSQSTTPLIVGAVVGGLLLVALVGLVWWALAHRPAPPAERTDTRRANWDSAMRKAGVEAVYPESPVRLDSLEPGGGRHSFDATFSGPELAALMNSYPLPRKTPNGEASLTGVILRFSADGAAHVSARGRVGGDSYSIAIDAPVAWQRGRIVSEGRASATVEGFPVPQSRIRQARALVLDYVNGYVAAAPGLEVESAEIESDGSVRVRGTAPGRLE